MILYEQGKDYWIIARRFHANRDAPQMKPTAVRDMIRLQQETRSKAVLKRVNGFIAKHRAQPPGNNGGNDGPRYA
jgi:hypothetical protein